MLPGAGSLGTMLRHPGIWAGGGVLLLLVVMAAAAPVFATFDPIEIVPRMRLKAPSAEHLLGTDASGRDV